MLGDLSASGLPVTEWSRSDGSRYPDVPRTGVGSAAACLHVSAVSSPALVVVSDASARPADHSPPTAAPGGRVELDGDVKSRGLQWELTEEEWAAADSARGSWRAREALELLVRAPRLVPYVSRLALRAARRGVWSDVELAVLLDSERVRQALPGTVRGVAWSPDQAFLSMLVPCLEPELRVLEIGCGVGRIARQVAPKVRELVCSDISGVMIREAAANLAPYSNVRCVQTSGYWLDAFPDASFDLVYAHAVFGFFDLYPMVAMLDATRRVLRQGGTCVIGFLDMDRPEHADEVVQLARGYAQMGVFGARAMRRYTEGQIRAMCTAVGLDVVDAGYGTSAVPDQRPHLLVTARATGDRPSTPSVRMAVVRS